LPYNYNRFYFVNKEGLSAARTINIAITRRTAVARTINTAITKQTTIAIELL
jgi:hypothetical protein